MPKKKPQALIVLRRSTDKQSESLEAQERDCRELCEQQGYEVKAVYSDTASGAASLDKRPGLVEAMNDLKKGNVLVARSASRLSREISVHLAIEDAVKAKKATLHFVDGGIAEDDPQKVLMRTIKAAFASYEIAAAAFRTRSALNKLRQEGRALGGPGRVRYGFKLAEDGKSLVPKEDEMKAVHRIWDLHTKGVRGRHITQIITLEGYKNRSGKEHHEQSIYRLIKRIKQAPGLYPFQVETGGK